MEHEHKHEEKHEAKQTHNALLAVIAYIIFFIPLLTEARNDAFVKFHVKQGLVLLIAGIVVNVIGTMLPVVGWVIILPLGGLAVFVLWILGIINALTGKEKELPLIGKLAKYFTF